MNRICVEKVVYGKLSPSCLKRGCDGSASKGLQFCCFVPMKESIIKVIEWATKNQTKYRQARAQC